MGTIRKMWQEAENFSCINVAERGRYAIQECTDSQASPLEKFYVLWDRNQRRHVTDNDAVIIYESMDQAVSAAEARKATSVCFNKKPHEQITEEASYGAYELDR